MCALDIDRLDRDSPGQVPLFKELTGSSRLGGLGLCACNIKGLSLETEQSED